MNIKAFTALVGTLSLGALATGCATSSNAARPTAEQKGADAACGASKGSEAACAATKEKGGEAACGSAQPQ